MIKKIYDSWNDLGVEVAKYMLKRTTKSEISELLRSNMNRGFFLTGLFNYLEVELKFISECLGENDD